MNKWSGRTEKKTNESGIKVLWDNIKHDNLCIIRILEGEKGSKCMWRNYDWKLPKSKEENRNPGIGNRIQKKEVLKQIHIKHIIINIAKEKTKRRF